MDQLLYSANKTCSLNQVNKFKTKNNQLKINNYNQRISKEMKMF